MHWLELTVDEPPGEVLPVVIRGTGCRTSAELFAAWAQALDFPSHFGHNWNAFHDCVSERALWHSDPDGPPPAGPLTILVEDAFLLLTDAPPPELEVLLQTLSDAATVADDDEDTGVYPDGFRLHVLLRDTPDRLRVLARRVRAADPNRAPRGSNGRTGPAPSED
ncbi:barstar family protein [Streptomyces europaeiscabiei]|uniref:barstar family protein n=1 Tax=Streptomyces europaeiscabiei TaxID=146819 RepID=UPI0029A012D4|nr:barstar family protein [Streptomyces europaeiscabiei]MDX3629684.1 barstar family protein [Streptomyces europaeiscabiei]MDX3648301.1 barstar family protein [Streptomyces europaeiscabiei]